ncbi:family with sequence similarity 78 member Ab isoform X2 [Plectropomus leopardus]|nr:family with sequence similarity 78 member Ab isoform X2 [Plectropomus leopardus]XP_042365650.1 family with sequence similarity 78 member Ab isoform X2 [Plectropomus leopardus]
MGCIQSIRCKPKSFRDSIIVLEVNTSIDPNPTSIDESSSVVLRYRTPHFRAFARVLVPPVASKETWTIGWIQACNHMEFYNTYGNKGIPATNTHHCIAAYLAVTKRAVKTQTGSETYVCNAFPTHDQSSSAERRRHFVPVCIQLCLMCHRCLLLQSSWELPDLRDGKIQAISDSDGVNYPWYGNTTETCTVVGPTKKDSKFTVSMNDNFYPSVTWGVPVSDSNVPQLSSIHRDQSFTTWLVAINQATSETLVLQTIRWRMRLHIQVDPEKPLGHRAVLNEPVAQEQPQVMGKNESIPSNAMVKPNANDAQVLMWRPKNGDPVVVIPPKY